MSQPKKPFDLKPVELPPATPFTDEHGMIRRAMRQARIDEAERVNSVADLRGAEVARLEVLRDALRPVFAGVPPEADIFDHGLVTSERPRLFIDMVAYVEMNRERRQYRFVQDTRAGRILIIEDERLDPVIEAVTTYVARRLVERERAIATLNDPMPLISAKPVLNAGTANAGTPAQNSWQGQQGFRWPALLAVFALGAIIGAAGLMGYALVRSKSLPPASAQQTSPGPAPAAPAR